MKWISLDQPDQLEAIKKTDGYSIIFKHSTRCSVSLMAKKKFELEWDSLPAETPIYYLDLLNYRDISNAIAEDFQVHHESPQVLLIKDGHCIFEASHGEISAEEILTQFS